MEQLYNVVVLLSEVFKSRQLRSVDGDRKWVTYTFT